MKWPVRIILALLLLGAALFVALFLLKTSPREVPSVLPGHLSYEINVAHRQDALPIRVWYPTKAKADPELIGQNALFYGHYVLRYAKPSDGTHPLVVLVHGSGGNAERLGWLASDLANRGFVVVGTDHPGVRSMDSRQYDTLRIWERAQDVSAILDHLATQPVEGIQTDAANASVVGFSIGGQTALLLAGAQYDLEEFAAYCGRNTKWDCGWYAEADVDFRTIDAAAYGKSYLDPRVNKVVAIDPAGMPAIGISDQNAIKADMMVLNMGNAGEIFEGADATEFAAANGASYHAIERSWHFSFLAECSPLGDIVMRVMGEELICSDTGLRNRGDVHDEIRSLIGDFLKKGNP